MYYRVFHKKTDPLIYFDDNFGKYGPILTTSSLLQREIYDAQKLSYFTTSPLLCCHFYYVATLPSETNSDAGINVNFSGSCSKTN